VVALEPWLRAREPLKSLFALAALFAAAAIGGCSVAQPVVAPQPTAAPAQPLPFKGRLLDGELDHLPPAVAMSLSKDSPVGFSYREEITHDDYRIPLIVSALDPVTYVGSPLGDFGVDAFASLAVSEGDRVLGDYTARVHVSQSYSLYSQPTHMELERAARIAVRQRIDEKLYGDADRLARAIAADGKISGPAAAK
jgi:hypothetical protein